MIDAVLDFVMGPTRYALFTVLAIKSTAVIAVGLLLWLALHRAPASTRHMILGATLVATFLVPVIAAVSPPLQWQVSSDKATAELQADRRTDVTGRASQRLLNAGSESAPAGIARPAARSYADILLFAYAAGAALLLLHLLTGLGRIALITRKARPAPVRLHSTNKATGQPVRVMYSDAVDAPLTWGVRRPVVLLPAAARSWHAQDVENALLHECAHIERADWPMQIAGRLICTVYWFNPLAWLALRYLTLEAELAADDRVLDSGAQPCRYAEQLLSLSRKSQSRYLPFAATTMAEPSFLGHRVRLILQHGESHMPKNQFSKSALLAIVAVLAILISCTQLVAAPQTPTDTSGTAGATRDTVSTPLILAAAAGDNDEVLRLLRAGADVNETSHDRGQRREISRTALTTAASFGHLEVVRTLVSAGAPVDRVVSGDGTALIEALRSNHLDVARELVRLGADVNKTVRGDGSPLISATRSDNAQAVRFLLEQGADPDMSVRGDENPLYHAAKNGNDEIIDLLINAGVDIDEEWPGDGTALIVASRSGNDAAADSLMLAGARPDQGVAGDGNAMIVAAQRGDTELLRKMIATGADVNASVVGDGSPLIQAARNGHMDATVLLLEAGADINQVVYGDENALIGAAWTGDAAMVDYLLRNGADPNIKARTYLGKTRTALSQATLAGHEQVVSMLRAAGATE
jgi:ankyrin repeat protein/beta-lactamase regulating signal transducer with metallopeptidase domain